MMRFGQGAAAVGVSIALLGGGACGGGHEKKADFTAPSDAAQKQAGELCNVEPYGLEAYSNIVGNHLDSSASEGAAS